MPKNVYLILTNFYLLYKQTNELANMPNLNLIASFYWLCLAQKVVSGDDLYRKVGGEMVLKPDKSTVPDSITSILWKHEKNKVAELDKAFSSNVDIYAAFKERTKLDLTTGELRISGLMKTDSGVYSVEFNGKLLNNTYKLYVIKEVPKPKITSSCKPDKISCTLTCEGNTTDAEPVTYSWKVGDGLWEVRGKQLIVSRSNMGKSTNGYKYFCKLKNSVSGEGEVSEPVGEVFGPEPSEVSGVGVVVVVVVVVVIILMLVANIIAGILCVWKIKKAHPNDNMREIFSKLFCGIYVSDGVQPEQGVPLTGITVSGEENAKNAVNGQGNGAKASDGNNQTTAKVSDGVQPEQEALLTDITKTNEDDADKAEKGQENGGSNDKTNADVSVGPGGNDETNADVSVGPGGNDETKADVSVGPGGNDKTNADDSYTCEIKFNKHQ